MSPATTAAAVGTQGGEQSSQTLLSTPLPNPSLQVTADHQLKQVEAPVYAPGHGEVLLHIKATGVCGYVYTSNVVNRDTDVRKGRTFTSGKLEE